MNKKGIIIDTDILIYLGLALLIFVIFAVVYGLISGDFSGLWQKIVNAVRFWH